MNTYYLHYAGW